MNQVVNVEVQPSTISLRGDNRRQQIVVTAKTKSGRILDATRVAVLSVLDQQVAGLISQGSSTGSRTVLSGLRDGESILRVSVGPQSTDVPISVTGFAHYPPIHFANDVMPLFTKMGCNSGGCHGRASGQNGFKLSVFGFDPEVDYDALTKEARGRRIVLSSPEQSLLLAKATGRIPHGGGIRLADDSADYEMLKQWIVQGLPKGPADAPRLAEIRVFPSERILQFQDEQQLQVTARYSNGLERDVTGLASFNSNASSIADADRHGHVRTGTLPGDAAVTVSYMGEVAAMRILVPRPNPPTLPDEPNLAPIDQFVARRWKQLGLLPSPIADDATFLRRLYLDTIGKLPTVGEVREFLADSRPDKRSHWIDRVLQRDEYADLWSLKWSDILLVDRQKLGDRGAFELHRWLRDQFAVNRPYDAMVRELITATGNTSKSGPANLYRSVDNSEGLARVLSQAFLGVRLECAQCHHHPFEKWSQDDFYGLAGFFNGLERQPVGLNRVLVYHSGLKENRIPITNRLVSTQWLGGPKLDKVSGDPRGALAAWMTSPNNPWFAKLAVNRIWKHYLGRGLVEAEDDLRTTNPATNEPLLDYLAGKLVNNHFDLKVVMREILHSRVYQLSSIPNENNRDDEQNYSHFLVKRMPAEVMLDAICDVTDVPEVFPGQPPRTRAIELWDNRLPLYFLEIFGRPERTTPCECGRSSEPTMVQALHLMNAPEIEAKLANPTGRVTQLTAGSRTNEEIIEEVTLITLGRLPSNSEREVATRLFATAPRGEAIADYLWTLLNSHDFLFVQ